jgi:hypothetical protein
MKNLEFNYICILLYVPILLMVLRFWENSLSFIWNSGKLRLDCIHMNQDQTCPRTFSFVSHVMHICHEVLSVKYITARKNRRMDRHFLRIMCLFYFLPWQNEQKVDGYTLTEMNTYENDVSVLAGNTGVKGYLLLSCLWKEQPSDCWIFDRSCLKMQYCESVLLGVH